MNSRVLSGLICCLTGLIVVASPFSAGAVEAAGEKSIVAVRANMALLMSKAAFEEDKEGGTSWFFLPSQYTTEYGHAPSSFLDVLNVLDTQHLEKVCDKPYYASLLEPYEGLSFPVLWKLLDRERPLLLYRLDRFMFSDSHTRPDPTDYSQVRKLRSLLKHRTETPRRRGRMMMHSAAGTSEDVLMYVKLDVLTWLTESLENSPGEWPDAARKKAAERLERIYQADAKSAEEWYLKEGARRALLAFADKSGITEEMKKSVWDTEPFRKWFDCVEDGHAVSYLDALEELIEEVDSTEMVKLPKEWSKHLAETEQKRLVAELLSRVISMRELRVDRHGDEASEYSVLMRKGESKSGISICGQDILMEGGRCAWALERLLNIEMPLMFQSISTPDEEQMEEALDFCRGAVIQAMSMPQFVDVPRLELDERVKLAGSADTPMHVFIELAMDESVEVRKTLAENREAPLVIIKVLTKDPEDIVRKLARDNLSYARTIQF